jgi:hypothetical protein
MLARQSSPTPPVLPAPVVATIPVDIDKSLFRKPRQKRISQRKSGIITAPAEIRALDLARLPSVAQPPLLCEPLASHSSLRRAAELARRMRRVCGFPDGPLMLTRRSNSNAHLTEGEKVHVRTSGSGRSPRGREHDDHATCEDFQVAARRRQDVTKTFGNRVSSFRYLSAFRRYGEIAQSLLRGTCTCARCM